MPLNKTLLDKRMQNILYDANYSHCWSKKLIIYPKYFQSCSNYFLSIVIIRTFHGGNRFFTEKKRLINLKLNNASRCRLHLRSKETR